jgi:hypothetical protein
MFAVCLPVGNVGDAPALLLILQEVQQSGLGLLVPSGVMRRELPLRVVAAYMEAQPWQQVQQVSWVCKRCVQAHAER